MASNSGPTKAELQETLDDLGERVSALLDPALSREDVVKGVQEMDEILNGSEDDEDDEDEDEDEDEDDAA